MDHYRSLIEVLFHLTETLVSVAIGLYGNPAIYWLPKAPQYVSQEPSSIPTKSSFKCVLWLLLGRQVLMWLVFSPPSYHVVN